MWQIEGGEGMLLYSDFIFWYTSFNSFCFDILTDRIDFIHVRYDFWDGRLIEFFVPDDIGTVDGDSRQNPPSYAHPPCQGGYDTGYFFDQ